MLTRIYEPIIKKHLAQYRQMAFLSGPRQAGKTTLSKLCIMQNQLHQYLNWDNISDRELILSGSKQIFNEFKPDELKSESELPLIIFDEIHKYKDWKTLLKGYFDSLDGQCKIIVTGSAKLNVFRRGGDSMMGRYFLYRIHPLSVAELLGRDDFSQAITQPQKFSRKLWQQLLNFGGFPEPYFNHDKSFYQRWSQLKQEQLLKEDLREISKVHDIARVELLAHMIVDQISSRMIYTDLAKRTRVSEPTVRQWLSILKDLYYCFSITPWHKHVSRSLVKDPKTYLWDWSVIKDQGAKVENIVACHLRKATHFWTDCGLGKYDLYYLRDKDKREVDFLITCDDEPWLMVEVKSSSNGRISPHLLHFNKQLNVPHVLQVVENLPYIEQDCFALKKPMIVPLLTFLSQLV